MDFFFNEPNRVVDQVLGALARSAPLIVAEPGSGVRILARADWRSEQVAVLSGGGAGHEPSHAGFVGRGMLTAAVSGEVFASPSVAAVLAGLRHCCGKPGALLVVKNYTGDRLNFGLAAEQARREGLHVRTVIVADRAEHFASQLLSLGMTLSSCTLPGHPIERRSPELGLGIHNEPGAEQVAPKDAAEAVALVLTPLLAAAEQRYGEQRRLIVMLNNLGGCSTQELAVLTDELLTRIGVERIALLVRPAPLMTSLDMHGFSITLLPAEDDYVEALSSVVAAAAWPGVYRPHATQTFAVAAESDAEPGVGQRSPANEQAIQRVTAALRAAEQQLDQLDARSGDGDAGSTFAAGAKAVDGKLANGALSSAEPARLNDELGRLLAHAMGGSSGVLLSILFTATGTALTAGKSWPDALLDGIERVQHYGGAKLGDRTMLDALIPAVQVLPQGLAAAATAARAGAEHTATITRARAGRSAYVPEHALAGAVDPGAEAVALAFAALAAS